MQQIDWSKVPADYPQAGGKVPECENYDTNWEPGAFFPMFVPIWQRGVLAYLQKVGLHSRRAGLRPLTAHERMEHRRAHQ
jgi:hypothetical protein